MTFKKTSIALIASALLATTLSARDQIKIVGSSTVYPFSSSVAEELGKGGKFPTPVVESTGTGGGLKLFCSGFGIDTPDIANASRRIKDKELQQCAENAEEVEIDFIEGRNNFGSFMEIYAVRPVKSAPNAPITKPN